MNRNSRVKDSSSNHRGLGRIVALCAMAATVALIGCSGQGASSDSSSGSGSSGGSGSGTSVTTPQVTLTMVDAATQATSIIAIGGTEAVEGILSAKFVDSNGAIIPNAFVQFSFPDASNSLEFKNSTGATTTDKNGVAKVRVSVTGTATKQDAVIVTATATLPAGIANSSAGTAGSTTGATTFSGTFVVTVMPTNASVASGTTTVSMSDLTIGANPLSAYGSTNISVKVANSDGSALAAPVSINFSSSCASRTPPKAFVDASAMTVNGTATIAYRDYGCAGTDTVTATLSGGVSKVGQLNVAIPAMGALQFSGASASNIAIKGVSGGNLPSSAVLTFQLLDQNNQPLQGKDIQFSLDSTLGGVSINPSVATTDATGKVYTTVTGGSQPTTVSVLARAIGSGIQTQSSQLTVSTGLAAQRRFSIAANKLNIEGYNVDGVTSTITASAYDNSGNPVPDGTAIQFVSSAAGIGNGGASGGQCLTDKGRCSVTFTSAGTRPNNGRVRVLAYTVGEESFVDANNDGMYVQGVDGFDAVTSPNTTTVTNTADDVGDAFLDAYEIGHYTLPGASYTDPFGVSRTTGTVRYFNLNSSSAFVPANGVYDGTLQAGGGNKKYVFQGVTLVLSTSNALIQASTLPNTGFSKTTVFTLDDKCDTTSSPDQFNPSGGLSGTANTYFFKVTDLNGNTMPVGTTITFSSSNGVLLGKTNYEVINGNYKPGTPAGSASAGSHTIYPITVKSDAVVNNLGVCVDATGHLGAIQVEVTTPSPVSGIAGSTTTASFDLID